MNQLVEAIARVRERQQGDIITMRNFINDNYPDLVKALRNVDREYTQPKRRKGFNLVTRESKKHGFIYYARFSHKGKMLPTKFNTHTNNLAEAEQFARDNKTRLIESYLARKDGKMFTHLEEYFKKGKNLDISEGSRREYNASIKNKFIPFLKTEKVAEFEQITETTLTRFQDRLQSKGIKAQTVNNNMKPVKKILADVKRKGMIRDNPGEKIKRLKVHEKDKKERGCYDLERVQGVFNKRWKNEASFLLCLLIYTTGMRNSEIKRLCLNDIKTIGGCLFINVKESKTTNGIRDIPLHDFVYRKLKAWAVKNKKNSSSILFNYRDDEPFSDANNDLARMLKVSDEELERENITFYSGRHFWKTLMSAEGLGEDIEEIFMGHKVVGNVKKLYDHKDKWGRTRLIEKTRQVFLILDRCIFTKP